MSLKHMQLSLHLCFPFLLPSTCFAAELDACLACHSAMKGQMKANPSAGRTNVDTERFTASVMARSHTNAMKFTDASHASRAQRAFAVLSHQGISQIQVRLGAGASCINA
jgi:hypothetical protein